jgi:hypothetical protein
MPIIDQMNIKKFAIVSIPTILTDDRYYWRKNLAVGSLPSVGNKTDGVDQ